ncbi:MAG: hypothetical protein CM15mP113_2110 [Pseudomonadota bacterium]|nr:MAG: hypothetical protein CM15mP113_2110 [Pseudomonadota bacterium]
MELLHSILFRWYKLCKPRLLIPEPTYENLPVIGVSRLGIGATTDTGSNLLLNVEVSSATTSVGIGSTLFKINDFSVARDGHSFKVGDKLNLWISYCVTFNFTIK